MPHRVRFAFSRSAISGGAVGPNGVVPIVPAAILFDLGFGGNPRIRPSADCGYRAATAAGAGPVQQGNVGAGAGATVGKLGGGGSMKAGIGSAARVMPNGLVVAAIVAVNAVGDIIDPETGRVVAGTRSSDGKTLVDVRQLLGPAPLLKAGTAAARSEHDDRRRCNQREADQGAGKPHGADGRRRSGACDCRHRTPSATATRCFRWPPDDGVET